MSGSGARTLIEARANETLREGEGVAAPSGLSRVGLVFRGYRIVRELASRGAEAEIYLVERIKAAAEGGVPCILKLYGAHARPRRDILERIRTLGESNPRDFLRVIEADFDPGSGRWFEVQEHARCGSLQDALDDRSALPPERRGAFFKEGFFAGVAREVGRALDALHRAGLLHLDLKPANVLARSFDPMDLVLIDFGIASSLSPDLSKKFTQARGTPMYQSPESWVGSVGRASDWWGLGMILLEIAAGEHPFRGLSPHVIASALATRPVPIPNGLEAGRLELLRGLLTRDMDKRWGWDQVSRWLAGERGIPQYFEKAIDEGAPGPAMRPFAFMGRECRTLDELAAAFVQDEASWDKGKALLLRGSVRAWLEQSGEFEKGEDLERYLARIADPDQRMFCFTQMCGALPFVFCGHAVTLRNLLLFAGRALAREGLTPLEKRLVEAVTDGTLLACLDFRARYVPHAPEDPPALAAALREARGKSLGDATTILAKYEKQFEHKA